MDSNTAILKDNKNQAEHTIKKIKNNIEKYKKCELSDKKKIKNSFNNDFRTIREIISSMEMDILNVKSEDAEIEYKQVIQNLKAQSKTLMDEIKEIEIQEDQKKKPIDLSDVNIIEHNIDNMNAQQAMDKGDKILDEGDDAIKRMQKKIGETKDVSSNIKLNLVKQREQLANTKANLTEIDYSLDRANNTLKKMLRQYACDKLVLGMIVIIGLAILTIIIVAAVGGDPDNNFNAPHDIFKSKKKNTTKTNEGTVVENNRLLFDSSFNGNINFLEEKKIDFSNIFVNSTIS